VKRGKKDLSDPEGQGNRGKKICSEEQLKKGRVTALEGGI